MHLYKTASLLDSTELCNITYISGNEHWLNQTWTTSRSVPIKLPDEHQQKFDQLSMKYSSVTLDITTNAQGDFVGSYGTELIPAICEYGKHLHRIRINTVYIAHFVYDRSYLKRATDIFRPLCYLYKLGNNFKPAGARNL